ncbi:hypothetical protein SAMN04488523_1323 [Sulfitobacter brevis]|uniref:Uncharacterized protein n=1 Tax=Sulfitobacter brevis TaxID=74348 RepID=A0A1I2GW22_9RHOB|nr:hypothetical protein SAMN04488523_1323 [Sulfitobacter brevis]
MHLARSQPGSFGQIHAEPVSAPLVSAGHLSRDLTEVFLDETLVNLSARGKAGPQGMAGVQRKTLLFWQVAPNASVQYSLVLPRFSSGLFRAMFAMKEIRNGKEIHRRVST